MPERKSPKSPSRAEDLTPELDHDRVDLIQAARVLAMLDDVDDLLGNTLGERLRLVRCPLKLAVELTGGTKDGQGRFGFKGVGVTAGE